MILTYEIVPEKDADRRSMPTIDIEENELSTGTRSSWTYSAHDARLEKGITDFLSTFVAVYLCFPSAR